MLTQTQRLMERDGLFTRTVHPVVPPKVEYKLTQLGMSLGRPSVVFGCGQRKTSINVEKARNKFDEDTDGARSRNLSSLLCP